MSAPTVALLGVPLDANSSFLRGCAEAPAAIRAALHSGSANGANEAGVDVVALLDDLGDLTLDNTPGSNADMVTISDAVDAEVARGRPVISIGGDHSITYGTLAGVVRSQGRVSVVHIDAHPDTYDDLDGNPLSHASPFARAWENDLIERHAQIGIRTANRHQREQAERFGIEMVSPRELERVPTVLPDGPVYLTIDLDGLDPSVAPGVSHHEPGGLTFRELLDVIDLLRGRIIAADVVELNPSRDVVDMTAMVAAKLVKELTGAIVHVVSDTK